MWNDHKKILLTFLSLTKTKVIISVPDQLIIILTNIIKTDNISAPSWFNYLYNLLKINYNEN